MAYNLGRVALLARGDYSSSAPYQPLDLVAYQGICYICKATNTNLAPSTNL